MEIEVFRLAKWDGIVGLGFTLPKEHVNTGKSFIDRLITEDSCKEKIFIYIIESLNYYKIKNQILYFVNILKR